MLVDKFNRPLEWRRSPEFGFILTPVECPEGIAENGAFFAFVDDGCWAVYGGFSSDLMPLATGLSGGEEAAEAALREAGIVTILDEEKPVC